VLKTKFFFHRAKVNLYFCLFMKSLIELYKHHIYGIIGTLIFHCLLVGIFLLAEINHKGEIREDAIEIEIPVELINLAEENQSANKETNNQNPNSPSSGETPSQETTNIPSNRSLEAGRDHFFDEAYEKEVAEAKKLVNEVNDQLSKDIIDIRNIEMPEDVNDGKTEDEIKNVIFSGKSNIEYHLGSRVHLRLPIPVYLARGGGVVTVNIEVNREGKVVNARVVTNVSVKDEQIYLYSRIAAERTVFNTDLSAPAIQTGTIRYTFVPQ
jgi:hypothetical protein